MKFSPDLRERLLCPKTKSQLVFKENFLVSEIDSSIQYPIIDNVPVLIDNENSVFSTDDFAKNVNTTFELDESSFRKTVKKLMPKITHNIKAKKNYS